MIAPDLFSTPSAKPPWRAPTPGEHVCAVCGGRAPFGLGAQWLCREHVPADFLPKGRGR